MNKLFCRFRIAEAVRKINKLRYHYKEIIKLKDSLDEQSDYEKEMLEDLDAAEHILLQL